MRIRDITTFACVLLTLGGLCCSCAKYNDSCAVVEPKVWGAMKHDVDLQAAFVGSCEAPVGNFFADALIHYNYGIKDGGNDIKLLAALFPAEAIRDEVQCQAMVVARDYLPQGPITDQDIVQAVPFNQDNDTVVVVKMTGDQLKNILERSISGMGRVGDEASAQRYFLQISGEFASGGKPDIAVQVDCLADAQALSSDGKTIQKLGSRITGILFGGKQYIGNGTYYVATTSHIVEEDKEGVPNDGFVTFHDPDPFKAAPGAVTIFNTHVPVVETIRQWLNDYPQIRKESAYPLVENRITFSNCSNSCADTSGS